MARTSAITMSSMVGIVGRTPAVDEKVWCFLSVCLFVTLWNDEVCDNGNAIWSSVIFKTIMVSLHRVRCFACASIFNFFCGSPKFSLRGKFIPRIAIFCHLWGCRPTFFKAKTVKFGTRMRTWDSLPQAKFYFKKSLKGIYPFWANLYRKYQLWWFWAL